MVHKRDIIQFVLRYFAGKWPDSIVSYDMGRNAVAYVTPHELAGVEDFVVYKDYKACNLTDRLGYTKKTAGLSVVVYPADNYIDLCGQELGELKASLRLTFPSLKIENKN